MGNISRMYAINARLACLYEMMEPDENGEVIADDALFAELAELMEEGAATQNDIMREIKNLTIEEAAATARADAIKEEWNKARSAASAIGNRKKRLINYLGANTDATTKFDDGTIVHNKGRESVVFEDASTLAEWLDNHGMHEAVTYPAPNIDKTFLLRVIKSGVEVPNTRVERNPFFSVR